jgi:hypothetical protein
MGVKKRMRELRAEYPGAKLEFTGGCHIRMRLPSGRFVIASATPSDHRVRHQIRKTVRRAERKP